MEYMHMFFSLCHVSFEMEFLEFGPCRRGIQSDNYHSEYLTNPGFEFIDFDKIPRKGAEETHKSVFAQFILIDMECS